MPKVTEEHRATQRQRILDAAITVIQRKGLASTTMGEIIKESGLSAGAIYGYYAGKDELIRDIATSVVATKSEKLADLARTAPIAPPREALRTMLTSPPHDWIASGLLLQFWGAMGADEVMVDVPGHARTLFGHISAYLAAWFTQQGLDPERAQALAGPFMAIVQGYVFQASTGISPDMDVFLEAAGALLDGALAEH